MLQPATGAARESIDSVGGARSGSAGVSSLGQLLRQKYWQQDGGQMMKSADTQDSNVLGTIAVVDRRDDDSSANTLADLPPSYTSKSATLPLDSRTADDDLPLDDDYRDWQSPHHEPVQSIEFAEDSDDEVPDFHDSPTAQSDMIASGSSQLAPVTETAIDDDYELIHVQPSILHYDLDQSTDARAHSPVVASLHPSSRHSSPAPSDSSASRHHEHPPTGHARTARPPPPPPPPRRYYVEEDTAAVPFDPFESLPPPADTMTEELGEEFERPPVPRADDDPASSHHYWPHASKPTDL